MQQESYKYWAFISYSHRDQAWADWLHKALETYRVPRRLVGRETAAGHVPRRLFPVFRDLEELPSSPNLSGAIDQALLQSRYLIVIASPYAAVSKWVDQEIARFRALGRGDRILCLIVDGEPHADLQPGKGFLECFPPSLRDDGIEPIAADVRPGKDGKPATKLKLIAGLLGVGLDELRRRERRRRILQTAGLTAIGLLAAVVLVGLWQIQQREKQEALAQQALRSHIDKVYENGRQELLKHNEARAAVYFNEAYKQGMDTPALRFMLARAMRMVDAERTIIQTGTPVSAVRFSPDSRLIVTVGKDEIARVWDVSNGHGQFEFALPKNSNRVGPAFSRNNRLIYLRAVANNASSGVLNVWDAADGRLLASGITAPNLDHAFNAFDHDGHRFAEIAPDHAVEIHDVGSGRLIKRLVGVYNVVGFSRDGRRLLTGNEQGEVSIWDDEGRHKLKTLYGLSKKIVSLDDTEDGTLLAAAAQDGAVRVWQVADGILRLVAGHPSPNPRLVFNVDGTRLLTFASDGARVWNTAAGALVYARQSTGTVENRVDISSSGRWVLASTSSRLVMEDAQSGAELFSVDGHRGLAQARDISESDEVLATGGPDGRVVLWNMPRIPTSEFRHRVDALRWSDEPRSPGVAAVYNHTGSVIATGAGDGQLKFWDAGSHQLLRSVQADPKSVNVIAFSMDDSRVITGGESDGIKIWDAHSGKLLRAIDCGGKRVLTVMFAADSQAVAAATLGGLTRLWDTGSGEQTASFDRDQARAGVFSPDGKYFAIGIDAAVKLWDVRLHRFVWSTALKSDVAEGSATEEVAAIDFSLDGTKLLAASYGRSAYILDAGSGRIMQKVSESSASQINDARFDSAGQLAVMSDYNGIATIWHLDDGHTQTLLGHAGEMRSAEFSPNSALVLTSGVDGTGKIWSAVDGSLLDTVAEHDSQMPEVPFQAAHFNPDGRRILTGSIDGVIREWGLGEESRNPQQIDAVIRCRVPWQLDRESLRPASPDSTACALQSPQAGQ